MVLARGRSHETSIDDEQIAAGVPLQQLDRAARHVGKRGLLAPGRDFISESHLAIAEETEQLWPAPLRNAFELSLGANDLAAVASHLEDQVAAIGALSAFGFGKKFRAAAAQHDVDLLFFR